MKCDFTHFDHAPVAQRTRMQATEVEAEHLASLGIAYAVERVRADLRLIEERGFHRRQDLVAKLQGLLDSVDPARAD